MDDLKAKHLGIAVLDRKLLQNLSCLWDGPLAPELLDQIEQAIRAFLVSPVLIASHLEGNPWECAFFKSDGYPAFFYEDYEIPLGDTVLQYEFKIPESDFNTPFQPLSTDESSFLKQNITEAMRNNALEILPKWIETRGQAFRYIDAWYSGATVSECERLSNSLSTWTSAEGDSLPFKGRESLVDHAIFHWGPAFDANYLVGCHRAGLIVYGSTPIISLCADHLFSKWPAYLLKHLDEQFRESAKLLMGPGVGIALPPLTLLLLSRAPFRTLIPETLVEMRDEYASSRDKLWDMLRHMWTAPTFREQFEVLKTLSLAADSIFGASFDEKFDALNLGISATDLFTGKVSSTLSTLRSQKRLYARVSSVSFAAKLSKDLKKSLLNTRDVLNRHLTDSELREFATMRI